MAITWLKAKHLTPKTKGRYKSSHNDQGNKHAHHHKVGDKERALIRARQPLVVKVLTASGRIVYRRFTPEVVD